MKSNDPWWESMRDGMPVAERWAYFDHAAVAPLCGPAQTALKTYADDMAAVGDVHWHNWRQQVEEARQSAATMLGAQTAEIAVVRNTTEGINLVAEGFPWRRGDNVVTLDSEFPSNLYPWLNLQSRGVETRLVPTENERVDLNRVDEACDERTRILTVSWVGYATGWRNDVAALVEIAHRNHAYLFLDAIQGLGVFPLDVRETPIDFLAADGHKWLLGPEGAGLFYMRQEHLDLLRPIGVGWNSAANAGEFGCRTLELKTTAGRYEGGSYNLAGIAALAASLRWLSSFGIESISSRLLNVTDLLCRRLGEIGADVVSCRDRAHSSGIVSVTLPGRDPQTIKQQCLDHEVIINCRAGRIRVSPHAYTDEYDIERLISALAGDHE